MEERLATNVWSSIDQNWLSLYSCNTKCGRFFVSEEGYRWLLITGSDGRNEFPTVPTDCSGLCVFA